MASWWEWTLLGVIAYVIYLIVRDSKTTPGLVCKTCGYRGCAQSQVRGTLAVEIVLWLCLIIPGLIYSLWRGGARHFVCPKCGGRELIPADSPLGRKIVEETEQQ